jgi:hypothetical protein
MKRKILVNILIHSGLCLLLGNGHSVLSQQSSSNPLVVEAAIPVFPATAIATAQEGQVLVLVGIRNDGTVKSVEFGSGPSIFRPALKLVASRWKFAPTNKTSEERSVQLSFIFRLVPTETKSEDMLPIYRPPYEVEVRGRLPSVSKDAKSESKLNVRPPF